MSPVFSADPIRKLISKVGFEEAAKILDESVEALEEYIKDLGGKHSHEFFAEHNLWIRAKDGKLKPLIVNRGQKKIQAAIKRQKERGRPVRLKLLKARQFGGSTDFQGTFFEDLMHNDHKQYLTVCHDMESARNMRAMFQRFYDYYPKQKPEFNKLSDKWWKFKSKDSDYLIDTAEEIDTGRSFTIHRAHISEIAFYRDAETLMTGLMQAIPDEPDTMMFIESTGNGIGDYFYDLITSENDFELVFVAWYEIEEYTRPLEDKEKADFERTLDGYETILLEQGLTLEQLNWRRFTIKNKLNGDEQKFQQEYPATVDEAFIASGRPYFLLGKIRQELLRTEKLEPKRGYLDWEVYGEKVKFVEDHNGWWTVFKEPEEGYEYRYVTGSDVAEGKIVIEGKREPDNSSTRVRDRITQEEVAAFCGRLDTDLFAIEIHKANVWYKSACDCVERNSAGIAVINALKEKEGVNLFKRTLLGKEDDKETVEYGFQTNTATRDYLLSELRTWIREGSYNSDDRDFWDECLTFVHNDKGKPEAQRGKKDDRVLAAGLTIQAELQANEVRSIERPKERIYTTPDYDEDWEKEESTSVYVQF